MQSHPYIPNSSPEVERRMLDYLGIDSVEDLFTQIPARLRCGPMDLPDPIVSEQSLRAHVDGLLKRNRSSTEYLSFLGADSYHHYVPAVCDEINGRSEFLTAYSGRTYEDHGRYQALWEYAAMMGGLLEMDVVSLPTYDGYQASATSIRMAARYTGRRRALVASSTSSAKLSKFADYLRPAVDVEMLDWGPTGELDLDHLRATLDEGVAAVYVDVPNSLGVIDTGLQAIGDLAHDKGALLVVGVDPTLLGVLEPPSRLGADIVCGDIQALGMHVQFGGGHAGFIAGADDPDMIHEYPIRLYSVTPTANDGEYGFGEVDASRTSFVAREGGKEWLGTTANLWGITAGVYLALMGPDGMRELGLALMGRSQYLAGLLSQIEGVNSPRFAAPFGKEFVVDLTETGGSVADINKALEARGIFGGLDLSGRAGLDGCALYCTTELHSKSDLDRLAETLDEVVS
jgi:glycine dehydrogenase subunit 1